MSWRREEVCEEDWKDYSECSCGRPYCGECNYARSKVAQLIAEQRSKKKADKATRLSQLVDALKNARKRIRYLENVLDRENVEYRSCNPTWKEVTLDESSSWSSGEESDEESDM